MTDTVTQYWLVEEDGQELVLDKKNNKKYSLREAVELLNLYTTKQALAKTMYESKIKELKTKITPNIKKGRWK